MSSMCGMLWILCIGGGGSEGGRKDTDPSSLRYDAAGQVDGVKGDTDRHGTA